MQNFCPLCCAPQAHILLYSIECIKALTKEIDQLREGPTQTAEPTRSLEREQLAGFAHVTDHFGAPADARLHARSPAF